ncbi:hypothetical protein [Saccharopolyspora hattusasensis]|uniref:hypothetical protein n=1 Tax=Saccharopolyspora hattusasensis TaxID=1128679 RepID=UPI003D99FC57
MVTAGNPYADRRARLEPLRTQWTEELKHTSDQNHAATLRLIDLAVALDRLDSRAHHEEQSGQ